MTGTALVSYEERFARDAADHAQREARSGARLSVAGGTFSLGGMQLGQQIAAIVLDSIFENNYYNPNFGYDPDNPLPPVCYAISRTKKDLAPNPAMQSDPTWFIPQNWPAGQNYPGPCEGCPRNEWGSSEKGRGKACQNREKLYLLPAGYYQPARPRAAPELHLFDDPAHFAAADVVGLRLPVTSGEAWAKYVTSLASAHRRPTYAAYTEIRVVPDPKSQYKLQFELIELCPDALFEVLTKRVDAQLAIPFETYEAPTAEQRSPQAPQQRSAAGYARGGLRR